MNLLVFLCLCLVLGGLAFRHQIRAAVEDLRLTLFGVRVKVPARPADPSTDRPVVAASRQTFWPPVRVQTWPAFQPRPSWSRGGVPPRNRGSDTP